MIDKRVVLDCDARSNFTHMIQCPGCRCSHGLIAPRVWTFNGNYEKPTFSPSLLVQGPLNHGSSNPGYEVCHSFITDGQIQFLNDCTHKLAGQTVPLEAY